MIGKNDGLVIDRSPIIFIDSHSLTLIDHPFDCFIWLIILSFVQHFTESSIDWAIGRLIDRLIDRRWLAVRNITWKGSMRQSIGCSRNWAEFGSVSILIDLCGITASIDCAEEASIFQFISAFVDRFVIRLNVPDLNERSFMLLGWSLDDESMPAIASMFDCMFLLAMKSREC